MEQCAKLCLKCYLIAGKRVYWFSGDTVLTSISCGTLNVWAVDNQGIVYQRIGVKAPTSHSLNAAWLPVDMGKQSTTIFTHIATGPKDFMVWKFVNRLHCKMYKIKCINENFRYILHIWIVSRLFYMIVFFYWFYEEMQCTVLSFNFFCNYLFLAIFMIIISQNI